MALYCPCYQGAHNGIAVGPLPTYPAPNSPNTETPFLPNNPTITCFPAHVSLSVSSGYEKL